ncbi:MAG: Ig-like domain-containing protein, partial [Candidatus Paceibacterota bacterium]
SEALDSDTINSTNIQLRKFDGDSAVSAIVAPAEGNTKVIITPDEDLEHGTQYYFFVSDAVTDPVGNALDNPIGAAEKDENEFTTLALEPFLVTSVETVEGDATADDTYVNGWRHRYFLTINATDETDLFAKFSDWVKSDDETETIPANGNMRLLFNSATGGGFSIAGITDEIIESGTGDVKSYEVGREYTDQVLGEVIEAPIDTAGLDTDTSASGRQIQFDVFTKLPEGTAPGFYETDYNLRLGGPDEE